MATLHPPRLPLADDSAAVINCGVDSQVRAAGCGQGGGRSADVVDAGSAGDRPRPPPRPPSPPPQCCATSDTSLSSASSLCSLSRQSSSSLSLLDWCNQQQVLAAAARIRRAVPRPAPTTSRPNHLAPAAGSAVTREPRAPRPADAGQGPQQPLDGCAHAAGGSRWQATKGGRPRRLVSPHPAAGRCT